MMNKVIIMTILLLSIILLTGCTSIGEASKSNICNTQKTECLQRCDEKAIGYFCEKNCQENYNTCMNS